MAMNPNPLRLSQDGLYTKKYYDYKLFPDLGMKSSDIEMLGGTGFNYISEK